jgi:hypothetical protein
MVYYSYVTLLPRCWTISSPNPMCYHHKVTRVMNTPVVFLVNRKDIGKSIIFKRVVWCLEKAINLSGFLMSWAFSTFFGLPISCDWNICSDWCSYLLEVSHLVMKFKVTGFSDIIRKPHESPDRTSWKSTSAIRWRGSDMSAVLYLSYTTTHPKISSFNALLTTFKAEFMKNSWYLCMPFDCSAVSKALEFRSEFRDVTNNDWHTNSLIKLDLSAGILIYLDCALICVGISTPERGWFISGSVAGMIQGIWLANFCIN